MDCCNKNCNNTSVLKCSSCKTASYCSRQCQKKDWINGHKGVCSIKGQYFNDHLNTVSEIRDNIKDLDLNISNLYQTICDEEECEEDQFIGASMTSFQSQLLYTLKQMNDNLREINSKMRNLSELTEIRRSVSKLK